MDTHLDFAAENYETFLEEAIDMLAAGSTSADLYFTVAQSYRVLAICAVLMEADSGRFARLCALSAFARLAFLRELTSETAVHPRYICASKNIAFSGALAAGALESAEELAERSPTSHFDSYEYEDDFLFFHFMNRALLEPDDNGALQRIIARWESVLEGQSSGYLDVCRVISLRDDEQLPSAMQALIATREAQLERYRSALNFSPELYATEGKIFLEGVALVRLAEMRGLRPDAEYRFIPSMARIPLGTQQPAFESWRRYP